MQSRSAMDCGGTYRARSLAATWSAVQPRLASFGITRLADVTDLDRLNIPVVIAVRPDSRTLSVSQGKGLTKLHATVSAAMEAIETACAEDTQALSGRTRVWCLNTHRLVNAPSAYIPMTHGPDYGLRGTQAKSASSSGLASGNTPLEATLHGVYEIIERHTLARSMSGDSSYLLRPLDEGQLECLPHTTSLIDKVRKARVRILLRGCWTPLGVATFQAALYSDDYPIAALGSGSHADADVAAVRAVTEAAQSRLTGIVGTRDDLPDVARAYAYRKVPSWESVVKTVWKTGERAGPICDVRDECYSLVGKIKAAGLGPVYCAPLYVSPAMSVVRVVAPEMQFEKAALVDIGVEKYA